MQRDDAVSAAIWYDYSSSGSISHISYTTAAAAAALP